MSKDDSWCISGGEIYQPGFHREKTQKSGPCLHRNLGGAFSKKEVRFSGKQEWGLGFAGLIILSSFALQLMNLSVCFGVRGSRSMLRDRILCAQKSDLRT